MLYLAAASLSNGLARAQSGHSMSSHSTMATFAPGGGFSGVGSCTWVPAGGRFTWARAAGKTISTATASAAAAGAVLEPRRTEERKRAKPNMSIGRLPLPDCNGPDSHAAVL